MMRRSIIMPLFVGLLSGQSLTVYLPDTSITGPPQALNTALRRELSDIGRGGALSASYAMTDDPSLTYELVVTPEFPTADTVAVVGASGLAAIYLAEQFGQGRDHRGEHISFGHGLRWDVSGRDFFSRDSGYGVLYKVVDVSTKTIQAVAAWDESNGKGELVGLISLNLPNTFGPMRLFSLDFKRLSPITQHFSIEVGEPKLPTLPVGLHGAFSQSLRDSLYLSRAWSLRLTSLPSSGWLTSVGIGRKSVHVTDHGTDLGLIPSEFRKIEVTLQRDTFNDPLNPTHGYLLNLAAEGGTVTGAEIGDNSGLLTMAASADWVASLGKYVFAQSWQLSTTVGLGYRPQTSDFMSYGGGLSVRGYREDHILAPAGIIARNELRLPISSRARLYLFADIGVIGRDNGGQQILGSTGLGWIIPAGNSSIQADVALNHEQNFKSAKLHLRLVNILGGN